MVKKIKKTIDGKKNLLSNIFSLFVLQGANYILPLITLPYLVIVLGVEKFGILAFANAIIIYFSILIDYGFNLSGTREISVNRENKTVISEIFTSIMIIKSILLIISFIILYFLVISFDKLELYQDVYIFTALSLIGKVLFPVWFFQGIEKMKYITFLNIGSKLFFTLLIFVLVKDESDFVLVPLINSIGIIIGGIIALLIALKEVKFRLISVKTIRNNFNNSTSLFISNLSITLFTASNTLILGLFADNSIVGIYSSIERLIFAVKNLVTPIYQGLFPWLSKKTFGDIKIFVKNILPYIFFVSAIISIFIYTYADNILELIYHDDKIMQYSYILKIFSLVPFLSALNMLYNFLYYNAIKAYSTRMKIFLIAGIFNIIVGYILTSTYLIIGITISVVLTEVLLLILGIYFKDKKYE